MATVTRPTGSYSPSNPITNTTKYQDDSAATSPRVAISSVKVDGDINKAFDTLTDHDDRLDVLEAGGLSDGDKGDISVSYNGTVWTVDTGAISAGKLADNAVETGKILDDAVTLAKQASGTANRLQGFDGSGNPSEISVVGATLSGGTLTVSAGTLNKQIYTSGSGNWTTPSSITSSTVFKVTLTGGGGSGGDSSTVNGGGGAGATCIKYLTGLSASTAYAYAVGAGAAANVGGVGNTGGSSTLTVGGTTYTAAGGFGGSTSGQGGTGGTASNGDINIYGGDGAGVVSSANPSGTGGASFWGGGGRGADNGSTIGDGRAYGSGGGGASNSGNAGAGASGIIVIEWTE